MRDGEEPETVLVCEMIGALPSRGRVRGRKPQAEETSGEAPALPVRRATVALAERFADDESAGGWLDDATKKRADELTEIALAKINRAIAGFRASAAEPTVSEVSASDTLAIRIGFGTGDEVAAAGWTKAVKLPPSRRRRRHPGTEDIRPQQRLAAILAGREQVDPWELHALRAMLDHDCGRAIEAAAELRAAIAAFDATPPDFAANLREQIAGRLAAAREALASGVVADEALADAVDLFARLQDRRRRPSNV